MFDCFLYFAETQSQSQSSCVTLVLFSDSNEATTTNICTGWKIGDGIVGGEKQLGMVADRAACVALVRARYNQIC